MKKIWIMATVILAMMLLGGALIGIPIMMSHVEIPNYQVISSEKKIEIRSYQPMMIAEVEMEGERREAIRNGFRILADFIFGNNTVRENISMTAPVQQEAKGNSWKVSFVMPSEYSMKSLPKPNDSRVILSQIPAKKWIAIKFSGISTDKNLKKHEKKLMDYIQAKNIKVIGSPKYAFYNPPWTLPILRRNEIMLEMVK